MIYRFFQHDESKSTLCVLWGIFVGLPWQKQFLRIKSGARTWNKLLKWIPAEHLIITLASIPDSRTLATAKKNGINIDHYCRQLTSDDLEEFDYIFAMDRSNHQNILRLSTMKRMLKKYFSCASLIQQGKGEEVPDPYCGDERHFQEVFEILDRSTDNFLLHVES